jgi:hydroxyethylthiazole kinase-like uncharacterized protein yjeF
MNIVTAQQMKNIDRRAIRSFGIPGTVLMENAAAAVMTSMETFFDGLDGVRVGVLCGKGNNGGDGLALARRLRIRGVPVRVALLASFDEIKGEAKVNLSILRKMDVEILQNASVRSLADILDWSEIIVDALLGIGLSSPLKGIYARAVGMINLSDAPVVAIDIPTGINADTGAVMGTAIRADLTVSMAFLKFGLVLYPGADYAGAVRVAEIGIPFEVADEEHLSASLLDRDAVMDLFIGRSSEAHKGDFGHLMVIAGSPGKAGAAILAAQGALRTGVGLVSVAIPNSLVPIIQAQVAEAMCIASAESIDGTLGIGAEAELIKSMRTKSACAIGPGLSTHNETVQAVRNLIPRLTVPAVIDADGLNALAGFTDLLNRVKTPLVLTPHPGEMGRLLGVSSDDVQRDRIAVASKFARKHNATVVLKGAATVVSTPHGWVYINSTGNPGMASGGTGDALTGMIGSFLAQGYSASQAACLGVYLHGLAGDLAAQDKGEQSMIAGDLIERIPQAFKDTYA